MSAMVGLHIDAEWREPTIVGGAKALFVNMFGGPRPADRRPLVPIPDADFA
jgi:hypothetical protein